MAKFCFWRSFTFPFSGLQITCPRCQYSFHTSTSSSTIQATLPSLDSEWRRLMLLAWAPSTVRLYSSAQRQFMTFCHQWQLADLDGSPLPASELTILCFIASLSGRLTVPSIRNYLSTVRNLHIVYGFSDLLSGLPRVPLILKGVKRVQGDVRGVKTPITALVLLSMKLQLDFHKFDHVMFWAACFLPFSVF